MDWTNIKAASIDIIVDDEKLTHELESIPLEFWDSGIDNSSNTYWNSIWLTENSKEIFRDFKTAKLIQHSEWTWRKDLNLTYIKSLVESLPIRTVGMIRGFILEGPLVMHVDSNETTPKELTFNLGLTISSRLDQPMQMDSDILIEEKYVFFNDSIKHGFPTATGKQISIRIFGDFDYDAFNINKVYK